jgi:hypothetical protein
MLAPTACQGKQIRTVRNVQTTAEPHRICNPTSSAGGIPEMQLLLRGFVSSADVVSETVTERDARAAIVSEENFLRYRLEIVKRMADGPLKTALTIAIVARSRALRRVNSGSQPR